MRRAKLNPKRNNHDQYLENLIYHLDAVGEDKEDVQFVAKDPLWQREPGLLDYNTLCDLVISYHSGYGVPIELKGSKDRRGKAKKQIFAGRDFIEEVWNLPVDYGKMVVYSPRGYHYRKYNFKNDRWSNWLFTQFD